MEKQLALVKYEQAKRLKELGFDLETIEFYHEDGTMDIWTFDNHNAVSGKSSAPTVALALKWIRDVKKIFGVVVFKDYGFYVGYMWKYFALNNKEVKAEADITELKGNYEAAESALLDELLTILEKEKEQ
ncbi:MAG: hypothetical protein LBJ63_00055 [Prevotellaceae bacterium]|jgi:hypothetical protein|nr:hypothetical protein [Prevotellaceae bacterium]